MAKQKSKEAALVVAEERIIVDELVDPGEYSHQKTTDIRISHTNRKRFNEQALQDLAANVKEVGILQPILLRRVTPTDLHPELFEIVAGERRWRAACIAGLNIVPVILRNLSDKQAAEIQILENVQREDPHPLEEAEGYEQLMMNHGYNADQLADKIKKSRAYIYARLKLCALATDVRRPFLNDEISASIALLIARIPLPSLQVRAMAEIQKPGYDGEKMSFRSASSLIQQRYTLNLVNAKFPTDDAKLLAAAGSCAKCPKRTGNQPEIFDDVSADVCTDPDCFAEKAATYNAHLVVLAAKKGLPVYEGDEAKGVLQSQWNKESELVTGTISLFYFDRNAPHTQNGGTPENILGEALPPVAGYIKEKDGLKPIYKRKDVQKALEKNGACETVAIHAERMEKKEKAEEAAPKKPPTEQELERARNQAAARQETDFRVALYRKLRERGANGFSLESLREFVKLMVRSPNEYSLPDDLIGDVYPFPNATDDAVCAYIDSASLPEVQLVLVDLVMGECLGVDAWDIEDLDDADQAPTWNTLTDMAEHEGIDVEQIRRTHQLNATPISDIAPEEFSDLIRLTPERLADLTAVVMDAQPNNIAALQEAATAQGYTWAQWNTPEPGSAWVKDDGFIAETSTSPIEEQSPAAEVPPVEPTVNGDYVDPAEFEEPVVAPAKRAAKGKPAKPDAPVKTVLTPAAAWPFPKSN